MKLFKSKAIGWRLLRMLGLGYVTLCLLGWFAFNKLAFPTWAISDPYVPVPESFQLTTSDGVRISAEWHPAANAKKTLLVSHGNAEHIGQLGGLVRQWQDMGFSVLTYDFRGYGASESSPSERGLERDIQAVWDWVVSEGGQAPGDVIIYGRSVGGGPSCWLAERVDCGGLVLESSFSSALRVPTRGIRILPFDRFPSVKRLPRINCPLLLIHGTEDATIHPVHARMNFEAAVEPKRLLWIEGVGHNDLHHKTGAAYEAALKAFH